MEYFRLRLHDIRYSNKPAIRLKAIRQRKNSLRSNNILSLINAAPQALTISNIPTQSPYALQSRPSRNVHQKGCIQLIFYFYPLGSDSPVITEFTENRSKELALSTKFRSLPIWMSICWKIALWPRISILLTGCASRKRGYCISCASTWSVPNTPRSPC